MPFLMILLNYGVYKIKKLGESSMRMSLVDGCIVLSESLKDTREKRNQKTRGNFHINFLCDYCLVRMF